MKTTKWFLATAIAVLAVGCSDGSAAEEAYSSTGGDKTASVGKESGSVTKLISNPTPSMKRDVVKTGSLTVQVDKIDEAERKARELTESAGGRVDQVESTDLAGPSAVINMTLRIPVKNYESVMEKLESLGARLAKQVSVTDVTEKVVDMDARIKTMQAQEEVVRNMLKKSNNLSDSLTINNDLTRIRGEIESVQAQRKSLGGQAAYSTLELKLTQKATAYAVASTDPNWLQTSWASAWGAGTGVFRVLISIFLWLVVFSPIWIIGGLSMRAFIRWVQKDAPASGVSEGQRPA